LKKTLGYSYARVSSAAQEDGASLDQQQAAIARYAQENQIEIIQAFREVYSGTHLYDRPELSKILTDIRAGKIGALIAFSVDRLSRNVGHLALIVDECENADVSLHFVTEKFENTPEGRLLQAVRSYVGEVELIRMYERMVLRGKRGRLEKGKLLNAGPDLYGYRRDAEKGARVIQPDEAAVVRRIWRMAVVEHYGALTIARKLNALNIAAPSSGKRAFKDGRAPQWTKTAILRILREPAYAGITYAWRFRSKGKGRKRKITERPRDEWLTLPEGVTPAIVTVQDFEAAQTVLSSRRARVSAPVKREALLRGFIFCADCGRARSPDHGNYVYRCSSRWSVKGKCSGANVPIKAVELWAWQRFTAEMSAPDKLFALLRAKVLSQQPAEDNAEQAAKLRAEIRRIETQQSKLIEQFLDADETWSVALKSKQRQLSEAKRQAQEGLARLTTQTANREQAEQELDALAAFCYGLQPRLESIALEDRRVALKAFGVKVSASGREGWEFVFDLELLAGRPPISF
jgi:site-specific DNA recombinase